MASVTKRGKKWSVRYRTRDAFGNVKFNRVSFDTKEEAWENARRLERAANAGVDVHGDKAPIGLIVERWFSEYVMVHNEETTAAKYSNAIDILCDFPIFSEPVKNLNAKRFSELIVAMTEYKEGHTIKPVTALAYCDPIRLSLSWAFKQGIIASNPILGYEAPKGEKKKQVILEEDDIHALVCTVKGKGAYIPVLLALYGGLRREECAGLHWSEVDFKRGTVTILRAETQTCKRRRVSKQPKSEYSRRTVTLPKFVMDALKAAPKPSEYVCCNPDGTPYALDSYRQFISRAVEKINKQRTGTNKPPCPKASFHDLRHTHVAILIRLGKQPKVIQERLGHASISITMDLYGYLMTGLQTDVADDLERFASAS